MNNQSSGKTRVAIIFGGQSVEHEISILSARFVHHSLDPARYESMLVGINRSGHWLQQPETVLLGDTSSKAELSNSTQRISLLPAPNVAQLQPDVAFPIVHGSKGEDGSLQGLMEMAGIPYVGSGVLGSAIGMDKDVTKRLLIEAGIPVARYMAFKAADFERHPQQICAKAACLGFPLFIKPATLGSSVGVTKVCDRRELIVAFKYAFAYDTKVLAEEAIVGRELECAVLGNDQPMASGVGEIVVNSRNGFYSYDAKYLDEHGASLEIPARLTKSVARRIQSIALKSFLALECHGMARVDFFLTATGRVLVNEINTLPGFTAVSMYPKLWAAQGMAGRELISTLIDLAVERHAKRRALRLQP